VNRSFYILFTFSTIRDTLTNAFEMDAVSIAAIVGYLQPNREIKLSSKSSNVLKTIVGMTY
jgi:hypothetical protein